MKFSALLLNVLSVLKKKYLVSNVLQKTQISTSIVIESVELYSVV